MPAFLFVPMLTFLLVLSQTDQALAYVDPATSGYFLQMLMAGLLAAALTIKMFWRNLQAFFSRLTNRSAGSAKTRDGDKSDNVTGGRS